MATLIIDIETIGEDLDAMDAITQEAVTKKVTAPEGTEEHEAEMAQAALQLGLSPLTGEIVAIGVLDCEKDQGVIYVQEGKGGQEEEEENNFAIKPLSESAMLEQFWAGCAQYDTFVTFNGRTFDIPFLMVRSAIHSIRPSKDLMRGRYLYQQLDGAKHIDLLDQFTFYGALRRQGLHLWCRAFGVPSPKEKGISGLDIGELFAQRRMMDIARYNMDDLAATKALYEYWENYLRF